MEKFDISFTVEIVDRNQPFDENPLLDEIVADEEGMDLANKLLKGRNEFSTFKGAYRNALKLRKMYDKHEVVITPMYNILGEEGFPYFGTGKDCLSILPDGSIIPLSEYFIEGLKDVENLEGV